MASIDIVTGISIAKQRLSEHIPVETNAHNNRISIAREGIIKHDSSKIEAVFSASSLQSGYKEVFSIEQYRTESSFETPACRDMSLGSEELN
jgi:hypothetical protein